MVSGVIEGTVQVLGELRADRYRTCDALFSRVGTSAVHNQAAIDAERLSRHVIRAR